MVELVGRYSNLRSLPEIKRVSRSDRSRSDGSESTVSTGSRRHKVVQRLAPEQRSELIRAYEAGVPSTELMTRYNLGKGTVLNILKEAGVTRSQRHLSEDELVEAEQLYARGWSAVRIGKHLNFNQAAILTHLKRRGVEMRRPWDDPDRR